MIAEILDKIVNGRRYAKANDVSLFITRDELDYVEQLLLEEQYGKEPIRCQNCDKVMPDLCPVCEKPTDEETP